MRILAALILCLLFVPGYSGLDRLPLYGRSPQVTFTPVSLYPDRPERRDLGPLTYLGGMAMHSYDRAFGGFSAMATDGRDFLFLSDGGNWMRLSMPVFGQPGPQRFGAVSDGPGGGFFKEDRDTEAMAVDPATGQVWIAFERANAIWRYAPGPGAAEAWVAPREMQHWTPNSGAEAMVRLRDGRFLILGEGRIKGLPDRYPALIFPSDPTARLGPVQVMRYRAERGYRITDAAELPNGDVLVLMRRFRLPYRWFVRVGIIDRADIAPGREAPVRTIARFQPPVLSDNYEALAVTREGEDVIVWIASDDNESMLQQSLLMKFRLDMRKAGAE